MHVLFRVEKLTGHLVLDLIVLDADARHLAHLLQLCYAFVEGLEEAGPLVLGLPLQLGEQVPLLDASIGRKATLRRVVFELLSLMAEDYSMTCGCGGEGTAESFTAGSDSPPSDGAAVQFGCASSLGSPPS